MLRDTSQITVKYAYMLICTSYCTAPGFALFSLNADGISGVSYQKGNSHCETRENSLRRLLHKGLRIVLRVTTHKQIQIVYPSGSVKWCQPKPQPQFALPILCLHTGSPILVRSSFCPVRQFVRDIRIFLYKKLIFA